MSTIKCSHGQSARFTRPRKYANEINDALPPPPLALLRRLAHEAEMASLIPTIYVLQRLRFIATPVSIFKEVDRFDLGSRLKDRPKCCARNKAFANFGADELWSKVYRRVNGMFVQTVMQRALSSILSDTHFADLHKLSIKEFCVCICTYIRIV